MDGSKKRVLAQHRSANDRKVTRGTLSSIVHSIVQTTFNVASTCVTYLPRLKY
jgi:hypothetical protein